MIKEKNNDVKKAQRCRLYIDEYNETHHKKKDERIIDIAGLSYAKLVEMGFKKATANLIQLN